MANDDVVDLGAVEVPQEPKPDLAAIAGRVILRKLIGLGVLLGLGLCLISGLVVVGKVASATHVDAPGEVAFRAADGEILTNGGKVAHGNTPEAEKLARGFSEKLEAIQSLAFSGGKDESGRVSLTGGRFLTYCQVEPTSVCFLVHVPQLKRYKGDVREELLSLAWGVACGEAAALGGDRRLAVGLRGSLMYGALATGKATADAPAHRETASAVVTDPLFAFFAPPTATVAAGSTPAPR